MYKFKLERFEGPLDLLLQLIEHNELTITDVSLASVTEQYLEYLDKNSDLRPEELADFLVVAARLLLLKSRVLLPQLFIEDEEAEAGVDLTSQLVLYRLYVAAGMKLYKQYRSPLTCFARERAPRSTVISFSPPPSLAVDHLGNIFAVIIAELESFVRPAPELISRTISLQERIRAMRTLISSAHQLDFRQILADAKTRVEVIVSFLALLELVKQRHVLVTQDKDTDIILITHYEESYVTQE
ncbi:MAG: segregation/condensation protein A [Patescibacteria group bacterium]|jgi:segregation and condensation protein A